LFTLAGSNDEPIIEIRTPVLPSCRRALRADDLVHVAFRQRASVTEYSKNLTDTLNLENAAVEVETSHLVDDLLRIATGLADTRRKSGILEQRREHVCGVQGTEVHRASYVLLYEHHAALADSGFARQ
jgi:hypothetical protein